MRVIERNWLSSNMVVFLDADGASLIDTGYVKHAGLTEALVDRAIGTRPLVKLLNTHLHSDHCGGNARLTGRHDCEVWVPAASFDAALRWDEDQLSFKATGQLCDRFSPTGQLSPGDSVPLGSMEWRVMAAPGHDPQSIIFFQPEHRILISADALWEDGFGVIFPELEGGSGFAEQSAILDLIESLDPAWVIPGHGPPFDDLEGALKRARSRLHFQKSHPDRHAGYALKVLVRYLMLELEAAHLSTVIDRLSQGRVIASAARLIGRSTTEAINWAVERLIDGGQLQRLEDGRLQSSSD
jgi:glyoxylase-like metal-dependent hydrolase (beta-lactamase superfamily II)